MNAKQKAQDHLHILGDTIKEMIAEKPDAVFKFNKHKGQQVGGWFPVLSDLAFMALKDTRRMPRFGYNEREKAIRAVLDLQNELREMLKKWEYEAAL